MPLPDVGAPHWVGLLDAGGVLAVLALWLFLLRVGSRARGVAGICGGVLLLLLAGRALDRAAGIALAWGFPGTLSGEDSVRRWVEIGCAVVAFLAGAFVATLQPHPVVEIEEAPAPVKLPPLPAAAWSRAEVLGDAPEHVPAEDDAPVEDLPAPVSQPASQDGAVPLLAVALGIGLPLFSYTSAALTFAFFVGSSRSRLGTYGIETHLLSGVLAGLALLGAAVALDVRDRLVATTVFALVALGEGMNAAWPRTFLNQSWTIIGTGLAAGLLAPAALAALRRFAGTDRRAVLAGVTAALVVVAGLGVINGRAVLEQRRIEETFSSDVTSP